VAAVRDRVRLDHPGLGRSSSPRPGDSPRRGTDRSGAPVAVAPGRVGILQAGDTTRRNLVPDPGMDTSAAWIKGAGWAVTGGAGVHNPAASGDSLSVALSIVGGRNYRVAYDLTISAGNIRPRLSGGTGIITGTMRTAAGRWSDTLTSPVDQTRFDLLASSAASASIDNVLAYAVTPACLPQGTNYFWIEPLNADGIATWQVGVVRTGPVPQDSHGDFEQGAKGVDGGAVRLVGAYAETD